jgi:HPt (histidine-containing phosphotransfer) domain-containing protein
MSQVETNHDASETPTTARGGQLNGDSSRAPAKANSGIQMAPGAPPCVDHARVQPESQPPAGEARQAAPAEVSDAVDAGALETLCSMDVGDEGFMAKIIELFLGDLSKRLEALKAAAETRDGDALKRIAHALKGSCGHFGATRLAALCRKMEQVGAQQQVGDASETFLELEAEAGRVRIALEAAKKISPTNSLMMEEPD